jgi:hypothetical protein
MAAGRTKSEVITFKVDAPLREALKGISNRSDFIRRALVAALDNTCPLCCGTGVLSVEQQKHWESFAKHHSVEQCDDCHEIHLVCRTPRGKGGRRSSQGASQQ